MQGRDVDAVVLRSVPYGESDRVVTLFCRDLGCLGAIARGARKSQRRFGGGLDFGTTGKATLRAVPGRELSLLEGFAVEERRLRFGEDLARMAHGAYAAELVTRLAAPHHAENDLFVWVTDFLSALERQGAQAARLRIFELGVLRTLGLAPVLDRCAVCGRSWQEEPDRTGEGAVGRLRWAPEEGGTACVGCVRRGRPLAEPARQALVRLEAGALEEGASLSSETNVACREALAEIFSQHLTSPLKSVEFIHKMEVAETRSSAIYPPPLSQ